MGNSFLFSSFRYFIFLSLILISFKLNSAESNIKERKNPHKKLIDAKGCETNKKSKRKKTKILKFFSKKYRKIKKIIKRIKSDYKLLFFVIGSLTAIVAGLIWLGTSAWIIIGIVAGLLLYLAGIIVLFAIYIDNGFKLDISLWLILFLITGLFAGGIIWMIGINAVSIAILSFILYFGLGFAAFVIAIMAIISFFKALFGGLRF